MAIKIKRSGTPNNVPSSLDAGEIAINYADGRLFYGDGSAVQIAELISPDQWGGLLADVEDKADADSVLPKSGGSLTGKLQTAASTTDGAPLNIPSGSIPSSGNRVNGDIWHTASNFYVHLNGTTRTLIHTGYWAAASKTEAEAGTVEDIRTWSPLRVRQAIEAVTSGLAPAGHSHANASTSAAGFMSAADKSKLDGIQAGAQVNAVTSVAGKTGAVTLSASDISGLGNAATRNVGTASGTVAAGDDSRITGALQLSGGTMTGALVLAGAPTADLHAATKQYVDDAMANVPSVYTGTTAGETNFPVGHHVIATTENVVQRNSSVTARLGSSNGFYQLGGSISVLSGTWRVRGLGYTTTTSYVALVQRVA